MHEDADYEVTYDLLFIEVEKFITPFTITDSDGQSQMKRLTRAMGTTLEFQMS